MLAGALRDENEFEDATAVFEEALERRPDDTASKSALSWIYLRVGQIKEAISLAAEIVAGNPKLDHLMLQANLLPFAARTARTRPRPRLEVLILAVFSIGMWRSRRAIRLCPRSDG